MDAWAQDAAAFAAVGCALVWLTVRFSRTRKARACAACEPTTTRPRGGAHPSALEVLPPGT